MLGIVFLQVALAGGGFDHEHGALRRALDGAVTGVQVDYQVLMRRRAELDAYVATLADAPVSQFSREQSLAFWINAYNALTLDLILDEEIPASIMDLDGGKVWDTRRFLVAGERLTLNQIEHERIRVLGDGRVHAAVNCASRGCPPLPPRPIVWQRIEEELTASARRWAATNAYAVEGGCLRLSRVFEWYAADFGSGDPKASAVRFLRPFVDDAKRGDLDLSPCDWQTYDWRLNAAP